MDGSYMVNRMPVFTVYKMFLIIYCHIELMRMRTNWRIKTMACVTAAQEPWQN